MRGFLNLGEQEARLLNPPIGVSLRRRGFCARGENPIAAINEEISS